MSRTWIRALRRRAAAALTIPDATGEALPPRRLAWRVADTTARSLLLVVVLVLVGLAWQALA